MGEAVFVGAGFGERLIDIQPCHQTIIPGKISGAQAEGVAGAIQLFVMAGGPGGNVLETGDVLQQFPGADGVVNQITEFDTKYGGLCAQNSKKQAPGVVIDLESLLFRCDGYSVVILWVMSTR